MIHIVVDEKTLEVAQNASLLEACLANDIYIPNLCHIKGRDRQSASCRLCFVEVEGLDHPVTACTVVATQGMRVKTETPAVRRLQKAGLRFLLSVHRIDCRNCPANERCELQNIAKFLNMALKAGPLETLLKDPEVDSSHPHIDHFPNRCVLCGKCIAVCQNQKGYPVFSYAKRGFQTVISSYGAQMNGDNDCAACRRCVAVCPVAALMMRST